MRRLKVLRNECHRVGQEDACQHGTQYVRADLQDLVLRPVMRVWAQHVLLRWPTHVPIISVTTGHRQMEQLVRRGNQREGSNEMGSHFRSYPIS